MDYCKYCVADKSNCEKCLTNPKYKDFKNFFESDNSEEYYNAALLERQGYLPTCPRGYNDCIGDPAYIKYHYPDWYKELYGDKTPYEAAEECRKAMEEDPDEEYYCYDDEDK